MPGPQEAVMDIRAFAVCMMLGTASLAQTGDPASRPSSTAELQAEAIRAAFRAGRASPPAPESRGQAPDPFLVVAALLLNDVRAGAAADEGLRAAEAWTATLAAGKEQAALRELLRRRREFGPEDFAR